MAKFFGSQYQALKHVPERSLTCLKKLIMWECETLEVFPCGLNNLIAGKLSSVSVEQRAKFEERKICIMVDDFHRRSAYDHGIWR
jgi:hypothetical protein